jgi:hypothetical protein
MEGRKDREKEERGKVGNQGSEKKSYSCSFCVRSYPRYFIEIMYLI